MLPHTTDSALAKVSQIEQQFNLVSAALISAQPAALEQASNRLKQLAVEFTQFLQTQAALNTSSTHLSASTLLRLKRLAGGLAAQRENLIRRSVTVDQALHSLVPATRVSTYAATSGPYGNSTRQTGAFKYLAA
jgi:hypothetical protein